MSGASQALRSILSMTPRSHGNTQPQVSRMMMSINSALNCTSWSAASSGTRCTASTNRCHAAVSPVGNFPDTCARRCPASSLIPGSPAAAECPLPRMITGTDERHSCTRESAWWQTSLAGMPAMYLLSLGGHSGQHCNFGFISLISRRLGVTRKAQVLRFGIGRQQAIAATLLTP